MYLKSAVLYLNPECDMTCKDDVDNWMSIYMYLLHHLT